MQTHINATKFNQSYLAPLPWNISYLSCTNQSWLVMQLSTKCNIYYISICCQPHERRYCSNCSILLWIRVIFHNFGNYLYIHFVVFKACRYSIDLSMDANMFLLQSPNFNPNLKQSSSAIMNTTQIKQTNFSKLF